MYNAANRGAARPSSSVSADKASSPSGGGAGLSVQLRAADFERGDALLAPRERRSSGAPVQKAETSETPAREVLCPRAKWPGRFESGGPHRYVVGTVRVLPIEVEIGDITTDHLVDRAAPPADLPGAIQRRVLRADPFPVRDGFTRPLMPRPGETYASAASAAVASADPRGARESIIESLNTIDNVVWQWGQAIPVGVAFRTSGMVVDERPRQKHSIRVAMAEKSRIGLSSLRIDGLDGQLSEALFDADPGAEPNTIAQLLATLQNDPSIPSALRESLDEKARGPFDYGALAALGAPAIVAVLQQALPADGLTLDASQVHLVPTFQRAWIAADDPTQPLTLDAAGTGSAEVSVAADQVARLTALHDKMPDADLAELVTHLDGGDELRIGRGSKEEAGARIAVIVRPTDGPEDADAVIALAASSGYEVTVIPMGAVADEHQLDADTVATRQAAQAVEVGAEVLAALSLAMPGDSVVMYCAGTPTSVASLGVIEAQRRGFHASILWSGAIESAASSLLHQSSAHQANAELGTLENVSALPTDTTQICREVFIAMTLARTLETGALESPEHFKGRARAALAHSTLFTTGALRGQLEPVLIDARDNGYQRLVPVHAALVKHIEEMRAAAASGATDGQGAATLNTAVGIAEGTPDASSYTTNALGTKGTIDQGFAEVTNGSRDLDIESRSVGANGTTAAADAPRRALVIANTTPHPYIPGALRDGKAMAARLASERYSVDFREEQSRAPMARAIQELGDSAQRGERLFLYFAGHGGKDGLYGVDSLVVPNAVVAGATARSRARGAEITTTVDACNSGNVAVDVDSAFEGQDHLPVMAVQPQEHPRLVHWVTRLNSLRDLYLVMSGGGASGRDVSVWEQMLAYARQVGLPVAALARSLADRKLDAEGKFKIPLRLIVELHQALWQRIEQVRARLAKEAWLENGALPELEL